MKSATNTGGEYPSNYYIKAIKYYDFDGNEILPEPPKGVCPTCGRCRDCGHPSPWQPLSPVSPSYPRHYHPPTFVEFDPPEYWWLDSSGSGETD